MSLNINADTKILIFGDSNTGQIRFGIGHYLKERFVALGATADNIHISTNGGASTFALATMAARGEAAGSHLAGSITSTASFLRTSEYDIVFLSAGGNDAMQTSSWYPRPGHLGSLEEGGPIDRLADIFGEKLMWIAPTPLTRIRNERATTRYRFLTIGAGPYTTNRMIPSSSPIQPREQVCLAQSVEIYSQLIERRLGETENGRKVTYLDVRDMEHIPDAVDQHLYRMLLSGTHARQEEIISTFPDISDGLHYANPPPDDRPWVPAIAEWFVEEVLELASSPSEDDTEEAPTPITDGAPSVPEVEESTAAPARPSSPNVSLRASPCPPGTLRLSVHTLTSASLLRFISATTDAISIPPTPTPPTNT